MKFSHYAIGQHAEARAARYLERQGYKILDRNWRTRFCEIDLVAEKARCVYFVEVKSRANPQWGHGLEYITHQKLRQMRFAAHYWLARQGYTGDCQLAALSIDDSTFRLEFLQD